MAKGWTKTGLILFTGATLGIVMSLKPWQKLREEQASRTQAQKEMKAAEAEHAALVRDQARLKNDVGKEEIARERGYKRPEETPWEPE